MSTKITNIITQFTKFLDTTSSKVKKVKTIEDILNLPISSFKFLDKEKVKIIQELFEVSNIGEIAKLNKKDPFEKLLVFDQTSDTIDDSNMRRELEAKIEELKNKFPGLEKEMQKAITISSIIYKMPETSEGAEFPGQKVVVVGLDNAGKTAILTKFGKRLGINDLASLKPTKGIQRQNVKTNNMELVIWDFGGQKEYRKKYIENPEQYFLQVNLLIYVIDVQDSQRFDESLEYFGHILDIIQFLEEKPYTMIYIHKYDPDLKQDPELLLNIELLKDKIYKLIQEKNSTLEYEMYLTSIFSLISNEPKFSKYIKEVMTAHGSIADPVHKKVDGMGRILEETMNAIIRLSESISLQIRELDHRLRAIESVGFQAAQSGIPIEISSSQEPIQTREDMARSTVLDELKVLFKKQKRLEL
ncbi:MAG: 50S ribosome-binding GTPase [Candidatus Lokiarchaeota archaeon]|nr:50S ribosome-binding GTPase [Candidatus Lokiarchaeota archaeon]